ncbi:hypothetical protein AB833_26765 [Chromatiales bacterium (ex Bugula neritina AB1)]|nr:hypothetical protein AB833_26765 [Chromatiales bacterium (ex Bugula neritina AB1)]
MTEKTYSFTGKKDKGGSSRLLSESAAQVEYELTFDSIGRSDSTEESIKLDDNQLLEVELDSVTLLMTLAELKGYAQAEPSRGDAGNSLPTQMLSFSDSRGMVGLAIRVLRVLGVNVAEKAIQIATAKVEGWINPGGPGVYKLNEKGTLSRQSLPTGDEPVLLLLHGTASSTEKAFANLLPGVDKDGKQQANYNNGWSELYQQFHGRVFALEQKTLSQTPVTNVMQFLDVWSETGGPPLVLLSHSRGGIVGDYLSSLKDWEKHSAEILDALPAADFETGQLQALNAKISNVPRSKRPEVLRHIRVGSPAAGTSLASEKTHIWLSVLADLLGRIPGVGIGLGALGDLAVAIVKEGLEPGTLPGIDAQKSDSLFIKAAQFFQCEHTELLAVSGDSKGMMKKTLMVIFGDKNDLVVDTSSMLLGPRYKSRYQLSISDGEIIHTSYFKHPKLRRDLGKALDGNIGATDFQQLDHHSGSRGRVNAASPNEALNLPCAFLLPGIMGSELSVGKAGDSKDIWLDAFRLFLGKGTKLDIKNEEVKSSGVLEKGYEHFVDYVRAGNAMHVVPFGYDWRKTIFDSVDEFERQLQIRLQAAPQQPIVLLCHSMGGLVARAWRSRNPDTWSRIVSNGGRMVQFGTPNYGSWTVAKIFQGEEKILSLLAIADIKNSEDDWLKMISKFPGLLELSDFHDSRVDLEKRETWSGLKAKVTSPVAVLKKASKAIEELAQDQFEQDEAIVYVAGVSDETPSLDIVDSKAVVVNSRGAGDGRVLWPVGEGRKPIDYYMGVVHGDLLNSKEHFDAIIELALTGRTEKLEKSPPLVASRGTVSGSSREGAMAMPPAGGVLYPSAAELSAAALGGVIKAKIASKDEKQTLRLSVTHGNLLYCGNAVIVGHYIGDGIRRAERALDSSLNDVLTQRWNLGTEFYAGEVGTHEVALRDSLNNTTFGPAGAIVVGLGRMGELQKGDLIATVRNGVLKYAQMCAERGMDCSGLKLAALLIGSGQEVLKLPDVLDGTVRGVMLANKILQANRAEGLKPIRISELEFIEWHLDMAIEARHLLEHLPSTVSYQLPVEPGLGKTAGGHKRAYLHENTDWWDSLKVRMVKPPKNKNRKKSKCTDKSEKSRDKEQDQLSQLSFSGVGGRALGIRDSVLFNRREIDAFLTPILSNTNAPESEQVQALFEQLIPASLKPLAAQRRNLVVNMDPRSAYLPWEILVDRKTDDGEPMAVAAGLVRRIVPDLDDRPIEHVTHAEGDTAMLIGNPPGGPGFQNLPGAYREAAELAKQLKKSDWHVNDNNLFKDTIVEPTAARIRQDILVKDYRILHFAAHGIHDNENPAKSGVVIGYDHAREAIELFAPHHVRAIRNKPSLVFINCCHTGKLEDWSGHKLSASLAVEFIKAGVHCVIGAGWAVADEAAKDFSKTIYECLLQGKDFGFSVRRAREYVYQRHPDTNTWAAFQCYGDPGFVLTRRGRANYATEEETFCDVTELLCALDNIRSDFSGSKGPGSTGNRSSLLRRTNTLYAKAKHQKDPGSNQCWADRGDVLTQFAAIYCGLDEQSKAIEFLQLASEADRSKVPLTDLLLVLNYKARYAERRFYELGKLDSTKTDLNKNVQQQKACNEDIKGILDSLRFYADIHDDADTLQQLASAYKLFAMTFDNAKEKKTKREQRDIRKLQEREIQNMIAVYCSAVEKADKADRAAYYPAINAMLGYLLLRDDSNNASEQSKGKVANLRETIVNSLPGHNSKSFWDLISRLEADFTFALDDGEFNEAMAREIASKIIDVAARYGSPIQLDSVAKQFRCVSLLSNESEASKAAEIAYDLIQEYRDAYL